MSDQIALATLVLLSVVYWIAFVVAYTAHFRNQRKSTLPIMAAVVLWASLILMPGFYVFPIAFFIGWRMKTNV